MRVPTFGGKCRTHLDEERAAAPKPVAGIDPTHPWNKYVAKKQAELAPEPKEEPVIQAVEVKECAAPGCGIAKTLGRGLCAKHYYRVRSAVQAGKGSWDDKAFVTAALGGEFFAPKKEASPVPEKPKASKPAPKPRAPVRHRDVKPAKIAAPAMPVSRVNGAHDEDELPPDMAILLALAELNPDARVRVVRMAVRKWGGGMTSQPERSPAASKSRPRAGPTLERTCRLHSCLAVFQTTNGMKFFCSVRCRNRSLNEAYRARHGLGRTTNGTTP